MKSLATENTESLFYKEKKRKRGFCLSIFSQCSLCSQCSQCLQCLQCLQCSLGKILLSAATIFSGFLSPFQIVADSLLRGLNQ